MVAPRIPEKCSHTIPIVTSPKEMHHFFIVSLDWRPLANPEGEILVFLSHKEASDFGDTCKVLVGGYMIVGMGDKKWGMFRDTEVWTLVEEGK